MQPHRGGAHPVLLHAEGPLPGRGAGGGGEHAGGPGAAPQAGRRGPGPLG